jgi:hypothetical protein
MEHRLLLRLVMPAQPPDDVGHPRAVVAALLDHDAVVHDLDARPVQLLDLAGVRDLRDRVGVPDGGRQLHAAALLRGKRRRGVTPVRPQHPVTGRREQLAGVGVVPGGRQPLPGLRGGIRPRRVARVVLEGDHARRQLGEARVVEQRPLGALDVDLQQVDVPQPREDVLDGDARRRRRGGLRRLGDVRRREVADDERRLAGARPGARGDELPSPPRVGGDRAAEEARVAGLRLVGEHGRVGPAPQGEGREEADVGAEVRDARRTAEAVEQRRGARGQHVRRLACGRLSDRADVRAAVAHVEADVGAAERVGPDYGPARRGPRQVAHGLVRQRGTPDGRADVFEQRHGRGAYER